MKVTFGFKMTEDNGSGGMDIPAITYPDLTYAQAVYMQGQAIGILNDLYALAQKKAAASAS